MTHYGSVPFDLNTVRWGYPTPDNGVLPDPERDPGRSRGTVRLRSRDFRHRTRVDPRYFTDVDDHDMRVMIIGIRLARRIAEQAALRDSDYVTKTHNTVDHLAGTAKMGPDSDPMAVLDPALRVRGVKGLRVADAAVPPFLPAINPNITYVMIGKRCADLVRSAAG